MNNNKTSINVALVFGARPQIIKFGPLIHIAKKDSDMDIQRRLEDKNSPFGDRKTSERILDILKEFDPCPLKR